MVSLWGRQAQNSGFSPRIFGLIPHLSGFRSQPSALWSYPSGFRFHPWATRQRNSTNPAFRACKQRIYKGIIKDSKGSRRQGLWATQDLCRRQDGQAEMGSRTVFRIKRKLYTRAWMRAWGEDQNLSEASFGRLTQQSGKGVLSAESSKFQISSSGLRFHPQPSILTPQVSALSPLVLSLRFQVSALIPGFMVSSLSP